MNERVIPRDSTYDTVTFKLLSEGTDIANTYQVLSFVINREVNRIPTARLTLRDGSAAAESFDASSGDDLIPGKEIEIALGHDSQDQRAFQGIIVKQSVKVGRDGNPVLMVECKDKAVKLTVGRHNRYFLESSDSDAIEQVLGDRGLSSTVESTALTHPNIVQHYATDWDFILSRAEMNGYIALANSGGLKVKPPTTSGSSEITLTFGANLLEFEAEMDARLQYKAVKASAWSYANQALVEAEGAEPAVSTVGNLSSQDLAGVIDLPTWELRHSGELDQQELQAWADAQLLKSRLGKIQGRVKVTGYAEAKPDVLVELRGMGDRFNGQVYVSGIRHEMTNGSWFTHLQLGLPPRWFYKKEDIVEKPASGLLPGVSGLQIGIVVQIHDDPNGEDRIRIKIPTLDNDSEGIWARVAALDAGNNRGTFFRPEVDDEVILGFLNDDPRDPVVLGLLHSSQKPAPITPTQDNFQKGIYTRSEMKLLFDDEQPSMTLETPGGNKIVISDEDKGIKLSDQNGNTVTLDDSGISLTSPKDIILDATGSLTLKAAQEVTIEGLNVNATANAQFKAEGSAGAELSTSGVAVLKGSLVQIN
ncbi:MAG: type VI secretion system tip protein VgrG [Cyanobacteria bacterium P01_F01_bin.150]